MAPLEPRLAAVRLSRMTKRHFLSYQYPVLVFPPSKMSYYLSRTDSGYTPQTENPTCTMYIYVHTFLFTVQAGMSVASFSIHFSKCATPFT
jgi:hypothetical protein